MNIVFFDGYCNLCNGLVDWLVRSDKNKFLKFASLQGQTSAQLLGTQEIVSIIYYRDGQIFKKSEAVFRILTDLHVLNKLPQLFIHVPAFLRDGIYEMFAKNRYAIFGKKGHVPVADGR